HPTYRYIDSQGLFGPCRGAQIKSNKLLKVKCSARVQPIDYSLDEPTQGSIAVGFGSGTARYCTVFGGKIAADSGTLGRFTATNAPPPVSCPAPPVSCP